MTTSASLTDSSRSSSNWASGSSLSPFRSLLRMLNWQRDPLVEMQIALLEQRTKQLDQELALLKWMHSEIDLIEADLPSRGPIIDANSSDC